MRAIFKTARATQTTNQNKHMRTLLKLTLACAVLGSASLFAASADRFRESTRDAANFRGFAAPATSTMNCGTMVIKGAGKNSNAWEVVPCKQYSDIRPDDCRRACRK